MPFQFDNSYARLPGHFYAQINPMPAPRPAWLAINEALAALVGLEAEELQSPELLAVFAGNHIPVGAQPIALAYAGHQFGGFVPRLGDGRAILLGEVVGKDGLRRDIQLKGSGRTPFSRGGDGRAALGPVLREFLVSEAMFALGIPTTRALAAVLTGEPVFRQQPLPGAVLTRVASSHLRVGTFEYFAHRNDKEALEALVDYALSRHYPSCKKADEPAFSLLEAVMDRQSALIAQWLGLGFVHGVMNTDNCSIAGETLDFGPCAFLDAFDPKRSFSSIDQFGRYAFSNQPKIGLWNMARLAEALLPILGGEQAKTISILEAMLSEFPGRFERAYESEMRAKLGLFEARAGDGELVNELLALMAKERADYTNTFRRLIDLALNEDEASTALFSDRERFQAWLKTWRARMGGEDISLEERVLSMRSKNPAFIPRNHRVEEAISSAMQGDLAPFERLRKVLARPCEDQPEHAELAQPPGEEQWMYQTFCGT